MFHPLLASNFEGVDLIISVPVLVIAGLVGGISAAFRFRSLALLSGFVCGGISLISLLFALKMQGEVRRWELACGLVSGGVACALFFLKRKAKPF